MRAVRLLLAVAATLSLGGCGGGDGADEGLPAVRGPAAATLEVTGTEFRYDPHALAVVAGDVPVVLHNAGKVIHDLRLEGEPALIAEAPPSGTGTTTWSIAPGRYRMYCSISGHRAAGMVGVLEARPTA